MQPTLLANQTGPLPPPGSPCQGVVIEGRVIIPSWVVDLDSFRRWTRSHEYPESGDFAYLGGQLWVDLSMEELLTHNLVKFAFTSAFGVLLQVRPIGQFVVDRMRLSNPEADLSVEPDGLFYLWETAKSGKLRFVEGAHGGIMELEGSPDIALEIVSSTSVGKDTQRLRELYWRAGVREYWLVDARGTEPRFDILRHAPEGYVAIRPLGAAQPSQVLGWSFQLVRTVNPLGQANFEVKTTELA